MYSNQSEKNSPKWIAYESAIHNKLFTSLPFFLFAQKKIASSEAQYKLSN